MPPAEAVGARGGAGGPAGAAARAARLAASRPWAAAYAACVPLGAAGNALAAAGAASWLVRGDVAAKYAAAPLLVLALNASDPVCLLVAAVLRKSAAEDDGGGDSAGNHAGGSPGAAALAAFLCVSLCRRLFEEWALYLMARDAAPTARAWAASRVGEARWLPSPVRAVVRASSHASGEPSASQMAWLLALGAVWPSAPVDTLIALVGVPTRRFMAVRALTTLVRLIVLWLAAGAAVSLGLDDDAASE